MRGMKRVINEFARGKLDEAAATTVIAKACAARDQGRHQAFAEKRPPKF